MFSANFFLCPVGSWSTNGTIHGKKSDGSTGCDSLCPVGYTIITIDPSLFGRQRLKTRNHCVVGSDNIWEFVGLLVIYPYFFMDK